MTTKPSKGTRKPVVHYNVDYHKRRYAARGESIRQYAREYYRKNRERRLAYFDSYRAAHPGGWRRYDQTKQLWYQRNRKRFFYGKALDYFRSLSRDDMRKMTMKLVRIYYRQRGRCALSGIKLTRACHLDHIVPRSKGGTSDTDNLQFLDPRVNAMKSNMMTDEFLDLCRTIINHHDSNQIHNSLPNNNLPLPPR